MAWWAVWSCGGFLWFGRKLGLFGPAPERLRKIVAETSARMNVLFREVLLMHSPLAQAFAFPHRRG